MNNFREVNDDILKDWLSFREETELCFVNDEDRKHTVEFTVVDHCGNTSIARESFVW